MNKKFFLTLISIPGLLSLLPKLTQVYATTIAQSSNLVLSVHKFLFFSLLQSSILIVGSIFLGSLATKKFTWHDHILDAIEKHDIDAFQKAAKNQVIPALRYTIPAALCFIAMLYFLIFPLLDKNLVVHMNDFSLPSLIMRIFYGGIVEEILLRWNVLSILVWISLILFKVPAQIAWWFAIISSSIFFGCGHLPIYLATTTNPTLSATFLIIAVNSFAGIFFGWIFKQFGLISAMIAHVLFHVTWFLISSSNLCNYF